MEHSKETINEVASVFFFLNDYVGRFDGTQEWIDNFCRERDIESRQIWEYDTFEEAREAFLNQVDLMETDDLWSQGKHCGDCVKIPCTCVRCFVEHYQGIAQKWLDDYNSTS